MTVTPSLTPFKELTIHHQILDEALGEVKSVIAEPGDANIVLLYGPTGVGKTTLLRGIEKLVLATNPPADTCHPIVRVTAPAPGGGSFSWKELLMSSLRELREPLIDSKIESLTWRASIDEVALAMRRQRVTTPAARVALESAIRNREVRVLLIDEGHHIGLNISPSRRVTQLEFLKSLADATGVLIVLAGTYRLLDFRDLNAQLTRRTRDVHFRRYDPRRAGDIDAFRDVLATLTQNTPVKCGDLDRQWERLYEGSVGCVGLLKIWMVKALQAAVEAGSSTLQMSHLKATAWPTKDLRSMAAEIAEGEMRLSGSKTDEQVLRALLGLDLPVKADKKPVRKPGVRNPSRDVVGLA